LIVFGSIVAFSAYTWLLERRSPTLVATHTFVNPLVAVLLGWLAAGEPLTPRVAGAMGFVILAVLLLNSESSRAATPARQPANDTKRSPEATPMQTPRSDYRVIGRQDLAATSGARHT
jgi:hypothetical protein